MSPVSTADALRQSTLIRRVCPRFGRNRSESLVLKLRSKLLCSNGERGYSGSSKSRRSQIRWSWVQVPAALLLNAESSSIKCQCSGTFLRRAPTPANAIISYRRRSNWNSPYSSGCAGTCLPHGAGECRGECCSLRRSGRRVGSRVGGRRDDRLPMGDGRWAMADSRDQGSVALSTAGPAAPSSCSEPLCLLKIGSAGVVTPALMNAFGVPQARVAPLAAASAPVDPVGSFIRLFIGKRCRRSRRLRGVGVQRRQRRPSPGIGWPWRQWRSGWLCRADRVRWCRRERRARIGDGRWRRRARWTADRQRWNRRQRWLGDVGQERRRGPAGCRRR